LGLGISIMAVKPVPDSYRTVTPYLIVKGATQLVAFLERAFGAREIKLMKMLDGIIAHGDLLIGDSHVMLGEATGPWPAQPCSIYLYLSDCDAVYRKALAAGGTSVQEPKTQFYGDRHGAVKDPCGNTWWIATHVEDVPPQEMERRAAEAARQRSQ
jgi:PhnB protein